MVVRGLKMQSKKLPNLAELKRNLKKLLKKYDTIKDIIIFGSFVKGRDNPKDIDLAFLVFKKSIELVDKIKKDIDLINVHLDFIEVDDLYSNPLFLSLINEGYSIKYDGFIRDILNIKPMRVFVYDLKHLDKSKKTLFGMALKKCLIKIKGEKMSNSVVLIPLQQTSYFEDFLEAWGMKYKTKEWTVI